MKSDFNFLALDCEFNQPSGHLIEVGVCIGNLGQGVIYEKNWLISPNESLNPEIVTLTGISDQMIEDEGVSVQTLKQELLAINATYNPFVNPVVWGIGDEARVKEFIASAGLDFPLWGHRTIDVKTIYVFQQLIKNKSTRAGLKSALGIHKISFEGRPHRAKDDAKSTLKLFFHLVEKEQMRSDALATLISLER